MRRANKEFPVDWMSFEWICLRLCPGCALLEPAFSAGCNNYKDGWDQGWAGKLFSRGGVGRGKAKNLQAGKGSKSAGR